MKQPIKFTVVTVTYNAAALIARTIESVESQTHPAVEHIIIDGNSTDKTLEMVHHYMERNSVAAVAHEVNCLSEPDNGIYDAMNKALQMMTGRYVVFLNAGDTLHSAETLSELATLLHDEAHHPAVIYGDTNLVDRDGNFLRPRRLAPPADLHWRDFKQGMLVCHQAFYARTDLAKEFPYDLRYRFSADYDWTLRIMRAAEERGESMLNARRVLADYLSEGATTQNHRRSLWERLCIMGRRFGWFTAIGQHFWFVIRAVIKR
ncbi:MAG: glycosyltransferase [Alloprevotella sp.]|nr:glycosyltransferase [Alloprevotella sp.]